MRGLRRQLFDWVESPRFTAFIAVCIGLNAILLGLETVSSLPVSLKQSFPVLDRLFLGIFVLELASKLVIYRWQYFRDAWRNFDFIIILIALIPTAGAFSVLRSLRVLRTLRMLSVIPALKRVVNGLLIAVPGLGAVAGIIVLIFYIGAVMATKLFGSQFPDWFGSIGASAFSLFQVMTLESWSMGIVRPVMEQYPYAWAFFLPFILVTTFTMLNLFIAVIVNAMQAETDSAAESRAQESQNERQELLLELRRLRKQVEMLQLSHPPLPVQDTTQEQAGSAS